MRLEEVAQFNVVYLGALAALHLEVKDRADGLLEEWVVRFVRWLCAVYREYAVSLPEACGLGRATRRNSLDLIRFVVVIDEHSCAIEAFGLVP